MNETIPSNINSPSSNANPNVPDEDDISTVAHTKKPEITVACDDNLSINIDSSPTKGQQKVAKPRETLINFPKTASQLRNNARKFIRICHFCSICNSLFFCLLVKQCHELWKEANKIEEFENPSLFPTQHRFKFSQHSK